MAATNHPDISGAQSEPIRIDGLGEICPVPLLRLKRYRSAIRAGRTAILTTDHSCTVVSVEEYCAANGMRCAVEEAIPGVWEITVRAIGVNAEAEKED
ncbi:MAG: sulfurtransferase TusA family protein [Clostridiales bacterium]|nr:sulfurtransferase TusA family protein [Clostridiales bacterium]